QPLEDGRVVITRATGSAEFPAGFTLVAAANPCPCGYLGDGRRRCECIPHRVQQYRQKLSGPLLDRIDLRLVVPRLSKGELLGEAPGEPSSTVRDRVEEARGRQRSRYASIGVPSNAQLPGPIARREARLALLVLSALRALTPRRLLALAAREGSAARCLDAVRRADAGSEADQRFARTIDPDELGAALDACGARAVAFDEPEYPQRLDAL